MFLVSDLFLKRGCRWQIQHSSACLDIVGWLHAFHLVGEQQTWCPSGELLSGLPQLDQCQWQICQPMLLQRPHCACPWKHKIALMECLRAQNHILIWKPENSLFEGWMTKPHSPLGFGPSSEGNHPSSLLPNSPGLMMMN